MKLTEALNILRHYQLWRLGEEISMLEPKVITEAINVVIPGAKWQQDKMFTEEDMSLAFETGRNFQITGENNFQELIQQIKK